MRPSAWLRPGDLRDDVTGLTSDVPWEVFRGEPRADDIRQGGVGNCWYVCALSILAEAAPETLKNCVVTRAYNPAGAYKLRLCLAGEWRTLLVDDLLPCNALEMLATSPPARTSPRAPTQPLGFDAGQGGAAGALGAAPREGRGQAPRLVRGAGGRHLRRGLPHADGLPRRPGAAPRLHARRRRLGRAARARGAAAATTGRSSARPSTSGSPAAPTRPRSSASRASSASSRAASPSAPRRSRTRRRRSARR